MSVVQDAWDSLRGKNAAQRAEEAQLNANAEDIARREAATEQALGFFAPFEGLGQEIPALLQYLLDPNQQVSELQSNPLFDLSLQNLNDQTQSMAAARGRLSAGDTLQQISNNTLLAAQPFLDRRRQDVSNLLNLGQGTAAQQANIAIGQGNQIGSLLSNVGNIQAAQDINTQNNTMGLINQLIRAGSAFATGGASAAAPASAASGFGGLPAGLMFSDNRLKEEVKPLDYKEKGYQVYEWKWNEKAKELFGLSGSSFGVLYNDVAQRDPDSVSTHNGYGVVYYDKLGVSHGG